MLAGVNDGMAALDFDLACTIRLHQYDIDTAKARADYLAAKIVEGVNRMLGGGEEDGGEFV